MFLSKYAVFAWSGCGLVQHDARQEILSRVSPAQTLFRPAFFRRRRSSRPCLFQHTAAETEAERKVPRIPHSLASLCVRAYRSLLTEYRPFRAWDRLAMDDDVVEEKPSAKPYLTRLRLAMAPYVVHFGNIGYIKVETLHMLGRDVVQKTLDETRRNFELRYAARCL